MDLSTENRLNLFVESNTSNRPSSSGKCDTMIHSGLRFCAASSFSGVLGVWSSSGVLVDFLNLDFLESSWISWDHDFGNARQCLMREVLLVAQYEHSSCMRVYTSGKRSGAQIEGF